MAKTHDAVWRAFPSDILGRGEERPAASRPSSCGVDYFDGKSSVGYMELARAESASGLSEAPSEAPSSEAPPGADVYAGTEHTAGWLDNGDQLIAEPKVARRALTSVNLRQRDHELTRRPGRDKNCPGPKEPSRCSLQAPCWRWPSPSRTPSRQLGRGRFAARGGPRRGVESMRATDALTATHSAS